MRSARFLAVLGSVLFLTGPAFAGTKERLELLEREVADLRAAAATATQSALKLAEMEQQIQMLTGKVEELTNDLDQANARLASVTAALSGSAPPSPSGGPTSLTGDPIADRIAESGAPGGVELPAYPEAAFNYAYSFLLNGDYTRAETAFELYLKAFPSHPRTPDAQFRLGEIYLASGANADAADAFIAHIKKYPNDARAAEAYLKLGTAFSRMQQTAEACKVFKTMKSKFPNAAQTVQERAAVEMTKIGCK
ncbi:MAG: tol-pal system protein YbgF [Parvularculaceae bacterium]|nr:tol-pal system protein YbgF [Parvularculaceae bacterium]